MVTRLPRPRLRISFAAALVAALLLLQTLGLMHGVAHHRGLVTVQASEQAPKGWVDALFAGHEKGSACALFDQLLQLDTLHGTACAAAPAFGVQAPGEAHRAWHVALQAHGFLARGPPAFV